MLFSSDVYIDDLRGIAVPVIVQPFCIAVPVIVQPSCICLSIG